MEKQHNRGQDGAGFASIKLDPTQESVTLVELGLTNHNPYRIFLPNKQPYQCRI